MGRIVVSDNASLDCDVDEAETSRKGEKWERCTYMSS
jgi:hypothetical protein